MTRPESGSSTVHVMTATVLALVVAVVAWQAMALVRFRHQVEAAADLAALAGSQAAAAGQDGCAAAHRVARRNGSTVVGCRLDLAVATVRTSSRQRLLWGGSWTAHGLARAAPADYVTQDRPPPVEEAGSRAWPIHGP